MYQSTLFKLIDDMNTDIDNQYSLNIPMGMGGAVRKGIQAGLSGLLDLTDKKIKLNDSTVHSTSNPSQDNLQSIAERGLNRGTSVEKVGDKNFSVGGHRLIYNAEPDQVGEKVSRSFADDMPFQQLRDVMPPEKLKMVEFDADEVSNVDEEINRLKDIFGSKMRVRPYWVDKNGKMWYSKSAYDKAQKKIDKEDKEKPQPFTIFKGKDRMDWGPREVFMKYGGSFKKN